MVALLLFIMATLKTLGHRKVHLAITFSNIQLDIHFCFSKSHMCSCLERFDVRDVKETFLKRIRIKYLQKHPVNSSSSLIPHI